MDLQKLGSLVIRITTAQVLYPHEEAPAKITMSQLMLFCSSLRKSRRTGGLLGSFQQGWAVASSVHWLLRDFLKLDQNDGVLTIIAKMAGVAMGKLSNVDHIHWAEFDFAVFDIGAEILSY